MIGYGHHLSASRARFEGFGVALSACIAILMLNNVGHAAKKNAYHRWAVIATQPLQATGMTDLLTAELSQNGSVELVEREQLQLATKELELSAYFGSKAASDRLKLGQLLKADALLLLSLETHEKKQFVKLVVADCRYGARLRFEYLPFVQDRADKVAKKCGALVEETQDRFSDGIEQLVGVTDFLSKNLTHDFDHLQSGYATLLQTALGAFPGVAVIEMDEAHAIGRELALTSAQLTGHVVPLFVEGEFQMATRKNGRKPTVRLLVRASDGKKSRNLVEETNLPMAEVTKLLVDSLPKKILRLANKDSNQEFNRSRQRDQLANRADAFSQFGAFENSSRMREAALLLKPDDSELRLELIADYRGWQQARHREHYAFYLESLKRNLRGEPEPQETWEKTHAERLRRFHMIFLHMEELNRQRVLNPRESHMLMFSLTREMMTFTLPQERKQAETQLALEEFFWRFFPQLSQLDSTLREGAMSSTVGRAVGISTTSSPLNDRRSAEWQLEEWSREGVRTLAYVLPRLGGQRIPNEEDQQKTFDHLSRFLTQVVPQTIPLPVMASFTMSDSPGDLNGMIAAGQVKRDQVQAFYEKLRQSDQPLNKFYARCGLLSLKLEKAGKKKPDPRSLQEADELLEMVYEFDKQNPHHRSSQFVRYLSLLRQELVRDLGTEVAGKRHPLPKNPIPAIDPQPALRFQQAADFPVEWMGMLKCRDSLDVAWSVNSVFVMSKPGPPLTVYQGGGSESIYAVVFDGENLWIASKEGGIQVVSPDGKRLMSLPGSATDAPPGESSNSQLPPYDPFPLPTSARGLSLEYSRRPLHLHPLEPGKCLVIGRFGKHRRLWFAAISLETRDNEKSRSRIHVFHSATKIPDLQTPLEDGDPSEIFEPTWILEFQGGKPAEKRVILVGRHEEVSQLRSGRRPLAIDPESLEVSVFPLRVDPRGSSSYFPRYSFDGRFLTVSRMGFIDLYSPTPDSQKWENWNRTELVKPASDAEPLKPGTNAESMRPQILETDDFLYVPGIHWYGIDRRTWQAERLTTKPLALPWRFEHYSVSAHYGLVAWNRGDRLYQVTVAASENSEPQEIYPFVPSNVRARHASAVDAIQKLGGSVSTEWGDCRHRARRANFRWRTIVFLPVEWKGGDKGLLQLKELYNLCDLYLVQAKISDEGLQTIGQLPTLETLCLVETKATDKGLAWLKPLTNLSYCRIEGTAGGQEFSDAALVPISSLPLLEKLALYGSGFTDEGLDHLKPIRRLRELYLFDTATTKDGLSDLKKTKLPYFQSYENDSRRLVD